MIVIIIIKKENNLKLKKGYIGFVETERYKNVYNLS